MPLFLSRGEPSGQGYGVAHVVANGQEIQAGSSPLCWPPDLLVDLSDSLQNTLLTDGFWTLLWTQRVGITQLLLPNHIWASNTSVLQVRKPTQMPTSWNPGRARISDVTQLAGYLIHCPWAYSNSQFTNSVGILSLWFSGWQKGKKTQGFYSLLQVVQRSQRKIGPGAHGTICSELSKMKLFDICTAVHECKDRRNMFNEKLRWQV